MQDRNDSAHSGDIKLLLTFTARLSEVLPNTGLIASDSTQKLVDENGENMGEIDEKKNQIIIYHEYTHSDPLTLLLRDEGFNVEQEYDRPLDGVDKTKLLYGE